MAMHVVLSEDQRLCLLRSLNDCGGNANDSVLQDCLDLYGHNVSRDVIKSHLVWLQEQSCVAIENLSGCYVATLTARGYEHIEGRTTVPGIKRARRL